MAASGFDLLMRLEKQSLYGITTDTAMRCMSIVINAGVQNGPACTGIIVNTNTIRADAVDMATNDTRQTDNVSRGRHQPWQNDGEVVKVRSWKPDVIAKRVMEIALEFVVLGGL